LYEKRLWKRASLSIEAPLGKLERGLVYREFHETVEEGSGNGDFLALWYLC
jgi:hypothetical protein